MTDQWKVLMVMASSHIPSAGLMSLGKFILRTAEHVGQEAAVGRVTKLPFLPLAEVHRGERG